MWIVSLTSSFYRPTTDETSPRRTIATAQTLYMRFHLFFPYKDFSYIASISGLPNLYIGLTIIAGSRSSYSLRIVKITRHSQETARHHSGFVPYPLPAPSPKRDH